MNKVNTHGRETTATLSVLLMGDDIELAGLLADYLRQDGFATTLVNDGEHAIAEALTGRHEIVVIDVMMPTA